MMRRNVNITYIIENNGVYGLTKGQFSATADLGSVMKGGKVNDIPAIDMAELAITLGATYVARSFSGDRKQLAPLIEGALSHRGSAILDVISPCVTFNNHEGSTKSLKYVKGHLDPIHDIDFIPSYENIEADYDEGTDHEVEMHDGSRIILHKLNKDYDPTNKMLAINAIHGAIAEGKFLTGLIYYNPNRKEFAEELELCDIPLSELTQADLQPSLEQLEQLNAGFMK
jgi:2-oxoglutarate ferredoxin oxidoreductase subunit beta